ncbi:ABC transporter substrate-binding protein [Embleya sp. NPDC020886]|uniref:ABC transporter substrate-binding protein n=1 Tax=Embleya sp. NPDC020886 TaxID=3363980 RepID=UPI0037A63F3A
MLIRRGKTGMTVGVAAGLSLVFLMGATGCSSSDDDKTVVGSAGFTESEILAQMYKQLLDKGGVKASIKTVKNRELYEPELEKGKIAVVPEYAATMAEFLNRKKNGPDAAPVASPDVAATVAALNTLAGPAGLKSGTPSQAVDQNAFAVTKDFAAKNNLKTLSDLGRAGIEVKIAAGEECRTRPFCAPGLEKTYGIKVSGVDPLGVGTTAAKQAVKDGKDQLVLTTSTDATLDQFGLVVLTDDKKLQNADNVIPVVNSGKADKILPLVDKLAPVLTTEDLTALNKQVDEDRKKPADVAKAYLKSKNLI